MILYTVDKNNFTTHFVHNLILKTVEFTYHINIYTITKYLSPQSIVIPQCYQEYNIIES